MNSNSEQSESPRQRNSDRIARWLAPSDYLGDSSEYQRQLALRIPDTALWLLETEQYNRWQQSRMFGTLWVKGSPGCGKSVLAASTIDHFRKIGNSPVLFCFFRKPEGTEVNIIQSSRTLIQDWLAQLLPWSACLEEDLRGLTGSTSANASEEDLWKCLFDALKYFPKVYCVVDGVDDIDNSHNEEIFRRLKELASLKPHAVKLLVTSRQRDSLQSNFELGKIRWIIELNMDADVTRRDIKAYVLFRLNQQIPNRAQSKSGQALANMISELSDGSFLYVKALTDELLPRLDEYQKTKGDESLSLANRTPNIPTPVKSDTATEDLAERIQKSLKTGDASGPGFENGAGHVNNMSVQTSVKAQMNGVVAEARRICKWGAGSNDTRPILVRLLIERGMERAVPFGQRQRRWLHSMFEVVNCSNSVLDVLFEYPDRIDFNTRDVKNRSVFHAACNVTVHEACYTLPGNIREPPRDVWVKATSMFLKIAAYGVDIKALDGQGRTGLHIILDNPMIYEGHIIKFLQTKGGKELAHIRDIKGFTPLHYALRTLRPAICEALVDLGANILSPDPDGNTALHHIARQCLNFSQAPYMTDDFFLHPPDYFDRCLRLWRCYLFAGGSINVRDTRYNAPPLFSYLAHHNPTVVRQEADEDANGDEGSGETVKNRHAEHMKVLFDAHPSFDLFAHDKHGFTALHTVASRGRKVDANSFRAEYDAALFKYLLGRGLDPLRKDDDGHTSLAIAKVYGKQAVLGLMQ
ncbi:ankyrin repeat-containing domain protein [Pseudomassariella vexata]|uniref:Ankyrin repeat-containing domain protein n=1 Tax=Pseudomassariella vexata TaxID=1141098 RepID=A0A1Y2DGM5_9PEZI|nr:ankyrin repeat-containing domain protein [Pseudomassariella vexata]ORY57845.1 ankyrin repeat-containing domain protein [Pseudomassariella vexata]